MIGGILLFSSLVSTIWFALVAAHSLDINVSLSMLQFMELTRGVGWIALILCVLKFSSTGSRLEKNDKIFFSVFSLFVVLIIIYIFFGRHLDYRLFYQLEKNNTLFLGFLILSLFGLTLTEKLYRNTIESRRWAIRFFCFGLGGIFIYDFYLYSDAMLFKRVNLDIWYARGIINGFCVPLIAVATVRNPNWGTELFVSRHVVYRSVVVFGAGFYLIMMSATGLYVKQIGGSWGGVLQASFFFGALIILFSLVFSSNLRTRLKVNLAKHFYKNKYDYREEWLNFTKALTSVENDSKSTEHLLMSLANIVSCDGAGLWLFNEKNKTYLFVEKWGEFPEKNTNIESQNELTIFLTRKQWVIDIDQYNAKSNAYEGLELADWIKEIESSWLILPLFQDDRLLGFIILTNTDEKRNFNWEDADLLKTVGYQISSYLALEKATESLSEAKQFEAFNRLSAFVVHDIKNVVAQLSLITSNAEKFGNDPEFIADAFSTISDATNRTKRLLKNLNKADVQVAVKKEHVNLAELIEIKFSSINNLVIHKEENGKDCTVQGDPDHLHSVIEHLLQNAFDASNEDQTVTLCLSKNEHQCFISIKDQGTGMTQEFIETRLYRPFDTTKGNAGMGIGVYESRELISEMGGNLSVESEEGQGSTFTISLPVYIV